MKTQLILSVALFLGTTFSICAEKKQVPTKFQRSEQSGGNGGIHRSPLNLPIEVLYDTELGTLEISSEEIAGQASVYTLSGDLYGFSDTLNAVFRLDSDGIYILHLRGVNWTGEAKIGTH